MKKLSAYTLAKNCTDLNDINVGLEELHRYFASVEKVKETAYVRFKKLIDKKQKLENK